MTLTLTDDLDFGTKERVLPHGIYILNMKALSLTIQKAMANVKAFADKQTDGQKLYDPDLLMQGHKKGQN